MRILHADFVARSSLRFTSSILLVTLLISFAAVSVAAQGGIDSTGTGGRNRIQGRIYFPSGRRSDALQVKVSLESTSSERLSVIADLNGGFVFDGLSAGNYVVAVDAGQDYEPSRESVVIEGAGLRGTNMTAAELARANVPRTFNVIVTLRLKESAARAGVVDAALANIPKPAADEYKKALDVLQQTGNRNQAVEFLKTALGYYPEFALARNLLGVQYLKLGMLDKALEAFRAAVELRPDDTTMRLNYGVALLEKKDFAEAETQLKLVLMKNSNLATGHMYLGIVLIRLRQHAEAQAEFERAISLGGDSMGLAHYYLGGIFWGAHQYKRAADELELYLKLTPNARDAEQVRATVRDLRSKEGATPLENPDPNKVKSVRTPD